METECHCKIAVQIKNKTKNLRYFVLFEFSVAIDSACFGSQSDALQC